MRQVPGHIQAVIAPVVESLGCELVGIEYGRQGRNGLLRIYIDKEGGVGVQDCQRVSHQLSGVLDVEDVIKEQYQLEVSSPGLDRPLFTLQHFERFAGHKVRLTLVSPINGQRKFKGTIEGVEEGQVIVNIGENELVLALNAIDKANLIADL
ncbi:MAG: ribosome maturation factor RimP [Gammaproteobacteria bacterium]|nr:ribosome maturation factor RimP [Gammaproteobacteria bacterium]